MRARDFITEYRQGVAEGLFGIDDKIKGKIQNIVSDLSDIPGMWDHKGQTFTPKGLEKLKSVLKNNPKYIKYALNLDYRDYEAEGVSKSHDNISELKIANDNYYQSMGEHENFLIYVTKKPFRDRYVALAVHPRTEDEIVKVPGATKEQAVTNAKEKLDQLLSLRRRASGNAIIDFNVKFAQQLLVSPDSPFFAKITAGPQLVIAGTEMEQYPEIMSSEGFKRSGIRNVRSPEGTTRLPSIAMTGKEIAGTDLVANGRYIIGKESTDKDGNRVYDLIHDSTVRDKGEKVRINQPALTVGSQRPD